MFILYTIEEYLPSVDQDGLLAEREQTKTPIAFEYKGSLPLKLIDLKRAFPEAGKFHFRVKSQDPRFPSEFPNRYCWEDLLNEEELVDRTTAKTRQGHDEHIEIRAIPIIQEQEYDKTLVYSSLGAAKPQHEIPGGLGKANGEGDVEEYFASGMSEEAAMRPTSQKSSKLSAKTGVGKHRRLQFVESRARSLESSIVAKQRTGYSDNSPPSKAGSLFGKLGRSGANFFKASARAAISLANEVSTPKGFPNTSAMPNATQSRNLELIVDLLYTPFSLQQEAHVKQLKSIWSNLYRDQPFKASGPEWKSIGLKSEKVENDENVRNAGLLGVQSLMTFINENPELARKSIFSGIPIAKVVLDVTLSLCVIFGLTDSSYKRNRRPYWRLFNVKYTIIYDLSGFTTRIALKKYENANLHTEIVSTAIESIRTILEEGPSDMDEVVHISGALAIPFL